MRCCADCPVDVRRYPPKPVQLLMSNAPILHQEALNALAAGRAAMYGCGSDGTQPPLRIGDAKDPLRHGSETKIAGTEKTVRELLMGLRQSATIGPMVNALLSDVQ